MADENEKEIKQTYAPEMKVIPPPDPKIRFPDVAVIPPGQKSIIILPKEEEVQPPDQQELNLPLEDAPKQ